MSAAHAPRIPTVPPDGRRILLRLPNWLGDIVMAAPSVIAITAARPDATFVAQAPPAFAPLAALLPGVTEVIGAGPDRTPRDLARSRRALCALDLDTAVLFPRSLRCKVAPWLARVPVRLGYAARGGGALLTHRIRDWRALRRGHRSLFFGALAAAFGTQAAAPWRADVPAAALEAADRLLAELGRDPARPLVAFEPGASYGPAKCWPTAHFGRLADKLAGACGANVVTVGTAASREREAAIERLAGGRLLRAVGRTPDLLALLGLLARADLVVTNDTGPMHVAAAVGTPVLALFGATDPAVSGPIGSGVRRVLYEPASCSPCFRRICNVAGHPCLDALAVETVYEAARRMLAVRPSR